MDGCRTCRHAHTHASAVGSYPQRVTACLGLRPSLRDSRCGLLLRSLRCFHRRGELGGVVLSLLGQRLLQLLRARAMGIQLPPHRIQLLPHQAQLGLGLLEPRRGAGSVAAGGGE